MFVDKFVACQLVKILLLSRFWFYILHCCRIFRVTSCRMLSDMKLTHLFQSWIKVVILQLCLCNSVCSMYMWVLLSSVFFLLCIVQCLLKMLLLMRWYKIFWVHRSWSLATPHHSHVSSLCTELWTTLSSVCKKGYWLEIWFFSASSSSIFSAPTSDLKCVYLWTEQIDNAIVTSTPFKLLC